MASGNVIITIRVKPWVEPYVHLMARLGCGQKSAEAIAAFVKQHGLQLVR